LKIDLNGPRNNPQGIGAKIVVRFDDEKLLYYEHHLTRGYMSSVENIIHFGLGARENNMVVEILWPDGNFEKIQKVKGNQVLDIAYEDSKAVSVDELLSPFSLKKSKQLFSEVSKSKGIDFVHEEQDIVDYNVQSILPHKLTQNGPCLVVGDINGDTYEDFIVGSSAKFSPMIYLQKSDGTFVEKPLFEDTENKKYEEQGIALFDLENDGDLDLYLVSGSNEFPIESAQYNDRLFINNGKGEFKAAVDKMPMVKASGSVVRAEDFDQDGFIDLFVGGRTPLAQYPIADKSFLLKNNQGVLEDITDQMAPGLRNVGMVTDATWADLDNDGLSELIVVGEFMPITIFHNKKTSFEKWDDSGLEEYSGWWESIASGDFDKDGDIDLIAGNIGMNNLYRPSSDRPVSV
ncbi:MAG: hypothetical protein HKN31_09010, partial [Pricia sp.]|nr:hypothetical protein [Pricia sp.]